MLSSPSHEAWLAAHYALGKVEVEQGFVLSDSERSFFLRKFMTDFDLSKSLYSDPSKMKP